MSHSYKILDAQTEHDHIDKRDFLDVTVQISLDGEAIGGPRRFGFKLDMKEKAIRNELDRVVASLDQDAESIARNADSEVKQEAAKKTIKALLKAKR